MVEQGHWSPLKSMMLAPNAAALGLIRKSLHGLYSKSLTRVLPALTHKCHFMLRSDQKVVFICWWAWTNWKFSFFQDWGSFLYWYEGGHHQGPLVLRTMFHELKCSGVSKPALVGLALGVKGFALLREVIVELNSIESRRRLASEGKDSSELIEWSPWSAGFSEHGHWSDAVLCLIW